MAPSTPVPVEPSIEAKAIGTVDVAGSVEVTGGLLLSAQVGDIKEPWEAVFASGALPVKNNETDLGKLTLAFDLSSTAARPVVVRVVSFNAQKKMTGTLEGKILPAAPAFYQRFVLDLSSMKPVGEGKFDPKAPFVQVVLSISGPTWGPNVTHELRLDTVHYATPRSTSARRATTRMTASPSARRWPTRRRSSTAPSPAARRSVTAPGRRSSRSTTSTANPARWTASPTPARTSTEVKQSAWRGTHLV